MRTFACVCGGTLFFENTLCLACGREAGWCPACRSISGMNVGTNSAFVCANPDCQTELAKCLNYWQEGVCNRMVPAGNGPLCDSCRFNCTIPDLSVDGNREKWGRLEAAKRRLLYQLDLLRLPYGGEADGFQPPLSFDFKADVIPAQGMWQSMGAQERVYTGHDKGRITINIREADDVEREKTRTDFAEAHRTIIGHFRHEIGHYFWDVLVKGRREEGFRRIFGDHENPPYAEAMDRYYREGPPPGWRTSHVTAYAAMHPWEDWAETFALYLDMVSVLDTAAHSRLFHPATSDDFPAMVARYRSLGMVMNEMNRAMGLLDFVPEVITPAVEEKLRFVHGVVQEEPARMAAAD